MISFQQIQKRKPLLKGVQLLCALAWLLSGEGLAPAMCTWLAGYDSRHEVTVSSDTDGDAVVVLSHRDGACEVIDQDADHGLLVDLAMMIGHDRTTGDLDHVLSFSSLDDARLRQNRDVALALVLPPISWVSLNWDQVLTLPMASPLLRQPTAPYVSSPGPLVRISRQVMRC